MGCGCADRMRKYVLPTAGYKFDALRGAWIRGDDVILDKQVEHHHTRLVLQNAELLDAATVAAASALRDKARGLANLLR